MSNIYEDVIEQVGHENQDNYETLRNDTSSLSWLNTTPRVNESINHIITVASGSNSQNRFYDIDLASHSSGDNIYTRPTPRCKDSAVTVTAQSVQHNAQSVHIKIKYIVIEITIITLILILISHISCLKTIRKQTELNITSDILKSDKVTEWEFYEKINTYVQDPVLTTPQDPVQDPVLTPPQKPSNKGAGGL